MAGRGRRVGFRGAGRTTGANTVMKPYWRRLVIALALVLVTGCLGIIAYGLATPARPGDSFSLPRSLDDAKARWKLASAAATRGGMGDFVDTFLHGKIDTSDATLRREGLDRSIRRLISVDWQCSGYVQSKSEQWSQDDLEQMLSNRRALKVLQSIKALPAADREAKCRRVFTQAYRMHTNVFRAILQHEEDPSFPRNNRSARATHLSLCAAMFAAAESGRRDLLADEFTQLDQLRDDLELRLFSRMPAYPESLVRMMLDYALPDSRFQINALRLASSAGATSTNLLSLVDQECLGRGMETMKITIAGWDALIGGMPLRRPSLVPLDPSQAVTEYLFFRKPGGYDFHFLEERRRFVQRLRSLVLGQTDANPDVVITALTRTLSAERTPRAQCAAVLALGRLSERRDPRVLSALIAALNDADPAVARCAGIALNGAEGVGGEGVAFNSGREALSGMGAQADAAVPGLVRLLWQDPWNSLQDWAAFALNQLGANGSSRASVALAEVLNDPSFTTNAVAFRYVHALTAPRPPPEAESASGAPGPARGMK